MQTVKIEAQITKSSSLTAHDKYIFLLAITKVVMAIPTQTIEAPYVPQLPQQRQSEAHTAITQVKCFSSYTQQKALV